MESGGPPLSAQTGHEAPGVGAEEGGLSQYPGVVLPARAPRRSGRRR